MTSAIARANALDEARFIELFGPMFEHSPWVAEQALDYRPFDDEAHMLRVMVHEMRRATDTQQMALIRAHPELARLAGVDPTLTDASASEQASAGLDRLTPEEFARFRALNDAYAAKFGIPFIICVRLSDKARILDEMERRLAHDPETEIGAALDEIAKIAALRQADILKRLEETP
ncbi:OHCU decarboxylase [Novacetimonas maltaceti]|uniref:2-oxo-4-hydroxy-4-carboxy-5-ureidoimidazoline decarboxylase n=1 Tax=Novacetimonas maltaceti TaxID=1203393 RepID=A0A2S3W5D0_9PROT|nr:2-oxo-4-hydroxy-4-carboxy-5-ureidoimidazoline decarboxylase [Novacetimonas maltaceti]POF64069.1 Uric acid degradation bifunctional protein [Novacetimonas maltaceti]PYD62134.1 OHCU decarboxylase [Novacetimonas maltaceti]